MTKWHELLEKHGKPMLWPYPIRYDKEQEIETDVLIIGGGIAGCWAAISAARTALKWRWWKKRILSGAVREAPAATTGVSHRPILIPRLTPMTGPSACWASDAFRQPYPPNRCAFLR